MKGINSDVSNVDACDLVRFAIAVENLGASPKGAFDVHLSDVLPKDQPPCLTKPFNFQVVNGKGESFHCNGGLLCSDPNVRDAFFSGAGITLDDAPGRGALAPYSPTSGENLAIITFDTRIPCHRAPPGCCVDTAMIDFYAGVEGGPNHVHSPFEVPFPDTKPFSYKDTAQVCVTPRLSKSIAQTSEPHTPRAVLEGQPTPVAIGEIIRYRLQIGVPEGLSPQMTLTDTLPAHLVWLPGTCAVAEQGRTVFTSTPVFTIKGAKLTVWFGNVRNIASDNSDQVLAVECDALVLNAVQSTPVNVSGETKSNSFTLTVNPPGRGPVSFTSNTVNAVVLEPAGTLVKEEVLPPPSPTVATYRLIYKNTGNTTAFDVDVFDPLTPLSLLVGTVSVSVTGPATPVPDCKVQTHHNTVEVTCPAVPAGDTLTVDFQAEGVPLCQPVTNKARLQYTSLPGLGTPKGTRGNRTGASTPGGTGADNGERAYGNDASVVTSRCPDLTIRKTHAGSFTSGQSGTYTITVTNAGNVPSVPPDTVTDTLPAGVAFLSGGGDGWSCAASGSLVTCTRNLPIPPGGSTSFTITVVAPCGQTAVENCATVSTTLDSNPGNNRACDPTAVKPQAAHGCFIAVAAGGSEHGHSLALRDDGTVWAWGDDSSGELGDGNPGSNSAVPVQVLGPGGIGGLSNVVAIAAGSYHSLAIKSDGTVWTWGDGPGGISPGPFYYPAQVPGLSGVVAVAGGADFDLALKNDGTVWAWGDGFYGELGIGPGGITGSKVPVEVKAPPGTIFKAIAAGALFAVAVDSGGTVWTWGDNSHGELGEPPGGMALLPRKVLQLDGTPLTDVTAVAAGKFHSLALKKDGMVWAWGSGELGDGTTKTGSLAVQVKGTDGAGVLTGAVALAATSYGDSSAAILSNGTVRAWGGFSAGRGALVPKVVPVLAGVKEIAGGGPDHFVALEGDGTVWAWGDNNNGQVGNVNEVDVYPPIQVTGLPCLVCTLPPSGMTAWWSFDEPGGPVAHDRAGLVANEGAWTPAGGPRPGPGRVDGALCFDGVSAHVEVPDNLELQLGAGDFTIDTWVRTTLVSGVVTLLDKRQTTSGDPHGYSLFLFNGRLGLQMADRAGSTTCANTGTSACTNFAAPAGTSIADGQWHHVAVTVRRALSGGGTFYVDGAAVGTFDPTVRPLSLDSTSPLWIAAERPVTGTSSYFNGCLDELEIFKRALDPAEVSAIFAAGGAGKCKCAAPQACVTVSPKPLTCQGKNPAGQPVLAFAGDAPLGGPSSVGLETVTSPHGAVQGFGVNGTSLSAVVVDTPPPDNPFCLIFGFGAQGRFHCETLVCESRPACP
jgi:uncharacterized repeat protein (TIGR01451 family)/fimbrial isopeptide formation D2 family protein